jgi:hypothetical protein
MPRLRKPRSVVTRLGWYRLGTYRGYERPSKTGPLGIGRIMCTGCCWRVAGDNAATGRAEGRQADCWCLRSRRSGRSAVSAVDGGQEADDVTAWRLTRLAGVALG